MLMRVSLVLALCTPLLAGLLLTGCLSQEPSATGTLSGHVYMTADTNVLVVTPSSGTHPVDGAEIRIVGTSLSTRTALDGAFLITNIPAGRYSVAITCPGYRSISLTAVITPGQTANLLNTAMQPAAYKWTVLVFMNADNDLEQFGVQDINEMESVPASDQLAVLVQMDRAPSYDNTNGDWQGTRRMRITHDDDLQIMTSPVMEDMGEVDMGQPSALKDFIEWGSHLCPAEHYLVVIWNHGSGWRSRAESMSPTRGVSFDDTSGTYIRTVDLPAALTTSASVDVVAFDASLMQMLEIAVQMQQNCRYIVGSEESPPGAGYAYQTWLGSLAANPQMPPRDLAVTMARETLAYYGTASNITHSVIDTAEVPGVTTALNQFANALIPRAAAYGAALAAARDDSEHYAYSEYKDLYHYAEMVKHRVPAPNVAATADTLMGAITRAVIAEYHGNAHPASHGISIFVPDPVGYRRTAAQYAPLALSQQTNWDKWLAAQTQ